MITETATVDKIEANIVWVHTIKQSVCGACAARVGCGQGLMNRFLGRNADICVSLPADFGSQLQEGDTVEIGIGESAVLTASLVTYGLPILLFVIGAFLGEQLSLLLAPVFAITGLVLGGLLTRWVLRVLYAETFFEPLLLRRLNVDCLSSSVQVSG